jgi:hypothetical protein
MYKKIKLLLDKISHYVYSIIGTILKYWIALVIPLKGAITEEHQIDPAVAFLQLSDRLI